MSKIFTGLLSLCLVCLWLSGCVPGEAKFPEAHETPGVLSTHSELPGAEMLPAVGTQADGQSPAETVKPSVMTTAPVTPSPMVATSTSSPTLLRTIALESTERPTPTPLWQKNLAVLAYPAGEVKPGDPVHPSVYLINAQMETRIVSTNGHASTPLAWSPRGDQLLFSTFLVGDDGFRIYKFDLSSSEVERIDLSFAGGTERGDPDWSSDGKMVAFVEWGAMSEYIHIWDIQENHTYLLTEGYHPKWIKNDEALAFLKPVLGGQEIYGKEVWIGSLLYQIGADGQEVKQIYSKMTLSNLSISPDGHWTIFLDEESEYAQLLKLDGTEVIELGFRFDNIYEPTWFPDGKSLLFAENCVLKRYDLETKIATLIEGLSKDYCYLYGSIQP